MKYKVAIIGMQGSFSKEDLTEIIKTNCSSFFTFQLCLDSDFEMTMAEIILELMKEECKYGLEVIIRTQPDRLSERCRNIVNEADNFLIMKPYNYTFIVENCLTILCFNKSNHSLICLASSQKRPVLFFGSHQKLENYIG